MKIYIGFPRKNVYFFTHANLIRHIFVTNVWIPSKKKIKKLERSNKDKAFFIKKCSKIENGQKSIPKKKVAPKNMNKLENVMNAVMENK